MPEARYCSDIIKERLRKPRNASLSLVNDSTVILNLFPVTSTTRATFYRKIKVIINTLS